MDLASVVWKAQKREHLCFLLSALDEATPALARAYRTKLPANLPGAMLQVDCLVVAVVNRDWSEPVVHLPLEVTSFQPLRVGEVIHPGEDERSPISVAECPDLDAEILSLAERACSLGLIHQDTVNSIRGGLNL
jgi:hypothetical protein